MLIVQMSLFTLLPILTSLFVGSFGIDDIYPEELLDDIKILSTDEMEGRRTGTEGNKLAREYLISRLVDIGVPPFRGPGLHGYEQPFDYFYNNDTVDVGPIPGVNVVSVVHGKMSKSVIVLSAHYDHLGKDKNGEIYNGADDNASGAACLLQLAEYFTCNPPQNTLIFVHFDAEESNFDQEIGLWFKSLVMGSMFFVNHPPVPLNQIRTCELSVQISHSDKSELSVMVNDSDISKLVPFLWDENGKVTMNLKPTGGCSTRTDSDKFAEKGIPIVYFSVDDHQDYHMPTDTYENINHTFVGHAVQAILDITRKLDEALANGQLAL